MPRATITLGIFLGVHVLFIFWTPFPAWGMDLLAYYPLWGQILFVLLSCMLLVPHLRDRVINSTRGIGDRITGRNWPGLGIFDFVLFAAVGMGLFVALRSASPLLGDGYLYLNELSLSIRFDNFRTDRAPLLFWMLKKLHELRSGSPPISTYHLYSYFSGFVYLVTVWFLARSMSQIRPERALVVACLLTPGYIQLFCGYVETYPLLIPGILVYLWSGLAVLRRRLHLGVCAALLGVLLACHFMLVSLIPSVCFLALLKIRESWPQPVRIVRTLLSLLLIPLFFVACLLVVGLDPLVYLDRLSPGHLLPLWAELGNDVYPYHLFDLVHLLDWINLLSLVVPLPLLILSIPHRRESPTAPGQFFLLIAGYFMLAFTFISNAPIGLFRDWDVMSVAAVPFSLWSAQALLDRHRQQEGGSLGFAVCGAALLHVFLWLGLNADTDMAISRFRNLLKEAPLTAYSRNYGWETLGRHYRDQGQYTLSLEAYGRAVEYNPHSNRNWAAKGDLHLKLGHFSEAIDAYEKALSFKSTWAYAWNKLGQAYFHQKRSNESLSALTRATELAPDDAGFHYDLCLTCNRLGLFSQAVSHCRRAVHLRPEAGLACYQLIVANVSLGDLKTARKDYIVLTQIDSALAAKIASFIPDLLDH